MEIDDRIQLFKAGEEIIFHGMVLKIHTFELYEREKIIHLIFGDFIPVLPTNIKSIIVKPEADNLHVPIFIIEFLDINKKDEGLAKGIRFMVGRYD